LVTFNFSPEYVFANSPAAPVPASVSGNTVTWNLTGAITQNNPIDIYYVLGAKAKDLVAGDAVQSQVTVNPIAGDLNPENNVENFTDTVTAGVDPNEMSVWPAGIISSGRQLQYTIGFENTGNDTAFNISVYDTLSPNVDVKSFKMIMASAAMVVSFPPQTGYNIVKFDFADINLLDSSHHGQCDGAIMFTVNALSGLPFGTTIDNHAGIFFDNNPVVMTNTVENVIGQPTSVATLSMPSKVAIYPNPATDIFTIKMDMGAYNSCTISNSIGQEVLQQQLTATQTNVPVKDLTPGLYYVTLRGDEGIKTMKFIKE
jgi:uncharacterized repeat protein (TIGR01451 family)